MFDRQIGDRGEAKCHTIVNDVTILSTSQTVHLSIHCQQAVQGRQAGQAMPLGLALIMIGIFTGLLLFNTGQLVTAKTRVTNTADAAVYSGLVWQTRALNFQSYTNRAMVANQVTIAQAVSLRSWSLYGKIAAENMAAVLNAVPVLNVASKAFQSVMSTTEKLIKPVTDVLSGFVDELNGVLSAAQESMYLATFVTTPEVVTEVIRKNDPTFSGDTRYSIIQGGRNAAQWQGFTDQYAEDDIDAMTVRSDLINRSIDPFSAQRDWEFFSHWFYVTPLVRFKMHKQGETRLVMADSADGSGDVRWEWKAKDNLSLNARVWRPFRSTKRIEIPIGWGQAFANSDSAGSLEAGCRQVKNESTDKVTEECERWFRWNRSAEYMSDNNIRSPVSGADSMVRMEHAYHGIRAFRDLSNLGEQDRDPRLVLRVEVEGPLDSVATSGKVGIGSLFNLQPTATSSGSGESLAAIASAEVYFQKPLTENNQTLTEYANGYSPFWDVRLVDTPVGDHALALQLRGVLPSSQDVAPPSVDATEQNSHKLAVDTVNPLENYSAGVYSSTYVADEPLENELSVPTTPEHQQSLDVVTDVFGDLSEQLTRAAESLLSGAVQGVKNAGIQSVGVTVEQVEASADLVVDGLVALQPDIDRAEAEARVIYERVRVEFESIKKDVALAYEVEKTEYELQVEGIQAEQNDIVSNLEGRLLEEADPEERKRLIAEIEIARDVANVTPEEREAELARLLVKVINERSTTYQIDFNTALSIVTLETDIGTSLSEQLRLSCGDVREDYDIDDC